MIVVAADYNSVWFNTKQSLRTCYTGIMEW